MKTWGYSPASGLLRRPSTDLYAFSLRLETVPAEAPAPQGISPTSSTRPVEAPARRISMMASSTLASRLRQRSMGGGPEGRSAQLGHVELDLPRGRGGLALAVAAAVGPAAGGALASPGAHHLLGLLLGQGVEGVLRGLPDEFPQIALQGLLVS